MLSVKVSSSVCYAFGDKLEPFFFRRPWPARYDEGLIGLSSLTISSGCNVVFNCTDEFDEIFDC